MNINLSIIHSASTADLTNYVYTQVYGGGSSGGAAIINGVSISVGSSSTIDIPIRSISGVVGSVYLLGVPRNVMDGAAIIGGSYSATA